MSTTDRILFQEKRKALTDQVRIGCRIVSDSMEPVIRVGESVMIEKISDTGSLRRFDILVFLSGDRLICHYFWGRNGFPGQAPFITRSMKNPLVSDAPIGFEDILGRVVDKEIPLFWRWKILARNLFR